MVSLNIFCMFVLLICFYSTIKSSGQLSFEITKTWNDQLVAVRDKINLEFSVKPNNDIAIHVSAPFYDDPPIPDGTPTGSMDKLWEYEVVEVFFLGYDDHYLEIEFSPKGQYLLLQLHGYRNVTKYPLPLEHYTAKIKGKEWFGDAIIPSNYLPPQLNKFNAYAIHGTNESRIYMALFPTPFGNYTDPDFHRLEYFQPIKFD